MRHTSPYGYQLDIQPEPFALAVYFGERLILRSAAADGDGITRPGSFFLNGQWQFVTRVISETREGDRLSVRCATSSPTLEVMLNIDLLPDGLAMCWQTADHRLCEIIGDAYDVASGGHWYGHGYHEPQYWPLEQGGIAQDPFLCNNVQSPIWLSSGGAGIIIPSEELLTVSLNNNDDGLFRIGMKGVSEFSYRLLIGSDIVDLFGKLMGVVGKPSRIPPQEVFALPIYSTWTQYPRYLTQEKVLNFAHSIAESGLPVGTLQIDEKYQPSFGEISFDPQTFPDPEGMMREIRQLGFTATLWTSPFINTDSPAFTELEAQGGLVLDARTGKPGLFTWWAGESGLLDLTSPVGERWYAEHLQAMQHLGFVGFKFDGGDIKYTPPFEIAQYHIPQRPQGFANRYLEFMAKYFPEFSESRVAWMVQREGLITREGGKDSHWGLNNGLHAMITQGLAQSMLGYPYLICDMIPGRVQTRFPDMPLPTDELFTRWVEASAFTPIMQFAYGPWNYDETTLTTARGYAELHQALGDYLYAMAEESHRDGTPMTRPLFFHDPSDPATYTIDDMFLLGSDLLVAPVITEGAVTRDIHLPKGEWIDAWTGEQLTGGRDIAQYPAPCPGVPLFIRKDGVWSERLQQICAKHLPTIPRGQIASGITTATYSATLARNI